jgi:hypothetical protein
MRENANNHMKSSAATLEPITRNAPLEQPARPARVRWVESLIVLLMLVGAVLPMTHRPTAMSRPEVINPEFVNEGFRYRDAEAGTFIAR